VDGNMKVSCLLLFMLKALQVTAIFIAQFQLQLIVE
jgi:hypothetical protein